MFDADEVKKRIKLRRAELKDGKWIDSGRLIFTSPATFTAIADCEDCTQINHSDGILLVMESAQEVMDLCLKPIETT